MKGRNKAEGTSVALMREVRQMPEDKEKEKREKVKGSRSKEQLKSK
jgi:hypothetical protein